MLNSRQKFYDKQNHRLVFVHAQATPDFWDDYWQLGQDLRRKLQRRWVFPADIIHRYIKPEDGTILEAGCGDGKQLYRLHQRGYKIIGIDYAPKTVDELHKQLPELDVRLGDVRELEFSDDYFIAYMSMGVIEHFWYGYDTIVKEMYRVLKEGGYAFLTFPYMSPLRKFKTKIGRYPLHNGSMEPENFYQFALNTDEVVQTLNEFGFELVHKIPFGVSSGVCEEIPRLQGIYNPDNMSFMPRAIRLLSEKPLAPVVGHTILLVLQKKMAVHSR